MSSVIFSNLGSKLLKISIRCDFWNIPFYLYFLHSIFFVCETKDKLVALFVENEMHCGLINVLHAISFFLFVGEHNANPTVRSDLVLVGTVFVGVETHVLCVSLCNTSRFQRI